MTSSARRKPRRLRVGRQRSRLVGIGERCELVDEAPAQARTEVFAQRQCRQRQPARHEQMPAVFAKAVEEREHPRLRLGRGVFDAVDCDDSSPGKRRRILCEQLSRLRHEHGRAATRPDGIDGGTQQVRFAGAGRSPEHHASFRRITRRQCLHRGKASALPPGRKLANDGGSGAASSKTSCSVTGVARRKFACGGRSHARQDRRQAPPRIR